MPGFHDEWVNNEYSVKDHVFAYIASNPTPTKLTHFAQLEEPRNCFSSQAAAENRGPSSTSDYEAGSNNIYFGRENVGQNGYCDTYYFFETEYYSALDRYRCVPKTMLYFSSAAYTQRGKCLEMEKYCQPLYPGSLQANGQFIPRLHVAAEGCVEMFSSSSGDQGALAETDPTRRSRVYCAPCPLFTWSSSAGSGTCQTCNRGEFYNLGLLVEKVKSDIPSHSSVSGSTDQEIEDQLLGIWHHQYIKEHTFASSSPNYPPYSIVATSAAFYGGCHRCQPWQFNAGRTSSAYDCENSYDWNQNANIYTNTNNVWIKHAHDNREDPLNPYRTHDGTGTVRAWCVDKVVGGQLKSMLALFVEDCENCPENTMPTEDAISCAPCPGGRTRKKYEHRCWCPEEQCTDIAWANTNYDSDSPDPLENIQNCQMLGEYVGDNTDKMEEICTGLPDYNDGTSILTALASCCACYDAASDTRRLGIHFFASSLDAALLGELPTRAGTDGHGVPILRPGYGGHVGCNGLVRGMPGSG